MTEKKNFKFYLICTAQIRNHYFLRFYVKFINLLYSIAFHSFFHILFMKQIFAVIPSVFQQLSWMLMISGEQGKCGPALPSKVKNRPKPRIVNWYKYTRSHTPFSYLDALYSFVWLSFFILKCFVYKLKLSFYRVISKSFIEEMTFKIKIKRWEEAI